MKMSVNGVLMDADAARIDPADRGFTLGDGIFETIVVRRNAVRHLAAHLARFRTGADLLGIPLPGDDRHIANMIGAVITGNDVKECVVRMTLTRGPGVRGLATPPQPTPTLLVTVAPLPPPAEPAKVIIAKGTRRNEHSPLSRIKHTNYLDNILARREAEAAGADDALLLNTAGRVAESTVANIFVLVDGFMLTPPVADGALPGIMRAEAMKLAKGEEGSITPEMLMRASEVFLTNALGVRPVTHIEGKPVGDGEPGLITQLLGTRL
ncbi:MAG: aminotransferase class IV [Rhodospirillaceae bacterium]|nr:aminotransferase class IV [Rhodospirillaceae bacterium]